MKLAPQLKTAIQAATQGDLRKLRSHLNANPEFVEDPRFLNGAALTGQIETAGLLLSLGADPDGLVPSHEGYRPLHRAIEHRGVPKSSNHIRLVEMLLDAGASLDSRATWMQLVPLAVAGLAGDEKFIRLLQKRGAKLSIFTAAVTGDVGRVRGFLKRVPATAKDTNNMTVLHYAAVSGLRNRSEQFEQIANTLLDAGADGDARENIGPYPQTPVLHFAAWKNYSLARVLLGRGCNPNFGFGNCLWREPGEMAELFLAHGADVNGRENSGQPLLNSRIHWNLPSVVLWLLKNGADPNLADSKGNSALHEAASRGINPTVVKALLAHGAKKKKRNQEGLLPVEIARAKKRSALVSLLE